MYVTNNIYVFCWMFRIQLHGRLRQGGLRLKANPGKLILQNPSPKHQSKMDWRCGSSSRTPALQEQSPILKTPVLRYPLLGNPLPKLWGLYPPTLHFSISINSPALHTHIHTQTPVPLKEKEKKQGGSQKPTGSHL
jgi:hypothetical protein